MYKRQVKDLAVEIDYLGAMRTIGKFNITKCGLIAAYNRGIIQRCSTRVFYTFYVQDEFGVIAYKNSGTIENCLSEVKAQQEFGISDAGSAAGIA